MAPSRRSRSVNKRYSYINEVSPCKDEDGIKKTSSRKRKLSEMLGPHWTVEELTRFYDLYRKNDKDWKKVAGALRNRTSEMVEALYSMNRAYLSLPHGTASAAGLTAMMTDHYSNLAETDSGQESNDGVGSSRKTNKRGREKLLSAALTEDEQFISNSSTIMSKHGCMSLLKKKRSGTRPRPVGKRTPRFPVSSSHANGGNCSPNRQALKLVDYSDSDEVTHKIVVALTEASQRDSSSQINNSVLEDGNANILPGDMDEDVKRSAGTDNVDLLKSAGDDIKEECSGTEEGHRLDAVSSKFDVEVNDAKIYRSSSQGQKRKSKKLLRKDESPFAALQTLADLSLMMPSENEDESTLPVKAENQDHTDESLLPQEKSLREKHRSPSVRMTGRLVSKSEVASTRASKRRKGAGFDDFSALENNQDSRVYKETQKKKRTQATNAGDLRKKTLSNRKISPRTGSPKLKLPENSSSADVRNDPSDSAQPAVQITMDNLEPVRVRSRRKKVLKKPEVLKDLEFSGKNLCDQSSLPESTFILKEKLSNCLSNQLLRRFCTFEWFYSAIDFPWFSKREFDEYLHHVGLGHVPQLTHVEWSFIRSSLGKPRRFSHQFLKQEKEKLNQYRNSVRKHYTELREGIREGLPTDLASPLSVGQRVIAIHPKTREVHDGSVLTVDHSKCRVQFNRNELGVEFVLDIDCMPLNPFENVPATLARHTAVAYRYFQNFLEQEKNGRANESINLLPRDNQDGIDDAGHSSLYANAAASSSETKAAVFAQTSDPVQVQAKEADVEALLELTCALEKKEAIVAELRRCNDDVLESQRHGDSSLKGTEPFKKHYAALLLQLNETNEQVSSALRCLRERNTYQGKHQLAVPAAHVSDNTGAWDMAAYQTDEAGGSHVNDIMDSSRSKASGMVNAAVQAMSCLNRKDESVMKIEEALDFVNGQLLSDESCAKEEPEQKSTNVEELLRRDLITKCLSAMLMIQKCTERQFPPSDVAQILDYAVTSLQPRSAQNLPIYTDIQRCFGIIKNQILALIPT